MPYLELKSRFLCPPAQSFALLSKLEDWPITLIDCSKMEFEQFTPLQVGARVIESRLLRGYYLFQPWEVRWHWTVVEWQPGRAFAMQAEVGGVKFRKEFLFEANEGKCMVRSRWSMNGGNLFQWFRWYLLLSVWRKSSWRDLNDWHRLANATN